MTPPCEGHGRWSGGPGAAHTDAGRLARPATVASILIALLATASSSASAQQRHVVVNGQLLHPVQVERIERLFCSPIADGRYWYIARDGLWGYEGDPRARGRFVDRCAHTAQRPGLSQRRLLYSTHEILSGRP